MHTKQKFWTVAITFTIVQLSLLTGYAQPLLPQDVILKLAESYERGNDEAFYQFCATEWKKIVPFEWVSELNERWRRKIKQLPPFPIDPNKTKVNVLTDTTATVEVTSQESFGPTSERHRQVTYALIKEGGEWKITNPYGHAIPIWWGGKSEEEKSIEAVMIIFSTALIAHDYAKMYELSQFTFQSPVSLAEYKKKAKKKFQITEYYSLENIGMLSKPKIVEEGFGDKKDKRAYIKIIYRARSFENAPFYKFYKVTLEETVQGWRILEN